MTGTVSTERSVPSDNDPRFHGEPKLMTEPRDGVPDVIDTLDGFHRYCDALAQGYGPLAAMRNEPADTDTVMKIGWSSSNAKVQVSACSTRSRWGSKERTGTSSTRR